MDGTQGFDVGVDEVLRHSSVVSSVARGVDAAALTAVPVTTGAFGLFGEFFAMAMGQASGAVADVIARGATSLDGVTTGLINVADTYARTDERHSTVFGQTMNDEGTRA
ncbi:hypothetical protein EV193_103273 [Herbihabitans rhizosphaerae]|uniref:Excreted virulence factor EspC (Type VII ESX diderm) n=1 Tax=Herbihabitans rhizosphaerae TaxID=1872711 RepID=A0A4Q7KWA2_9PSEU|nr:hypothetical protein [Herbihabitans rhizosphaerae]RZS40955.1 hypothetical protein EV193_103273 [Herbihabitans rhizosphaerae]